MKIAQIYIQDLQQFNNFQLDLTYPEGHARAGQAMDRVCLLGKNGAGKSNVFSLMIDYLRGIMRFKSKALFLVKLQVDERFIYGVHVNNTVLFFRDEIEQEPEWMIDLMRDQAFTMAFNRKYEHFCIGFEEEPELFDTLWLDNNTRDLVVHQPSDYPKDHTIKLTDMPFTKGHEAESLTHTFPLYNEISPERVSEFWALLVYRIAKRVKDFQEFQLATENKGKPLSILERMFEQANPVLLPDLAALWNPFLEPLGIEVGLDQAELPNHFRERLNLPLRRKRDKAKVEYGSLGTGLRHLLFNLGHVWALHHGRDVRHSFCFLEDPEVNLHPGLIEDVMKHYGQICGKSQLFVSTHTAQVAAGFAPEERIILVRKANGGMETRRGVVAQGASLEEVMEKDMG